MIALPLLAIGNPTRACWECRYNHFSCDLGRPSCRQCQDSGVECTGYDGTTPKEQYSAALQKWQKDGTRKIHAFNTLQFDNQILRSDTDWIVEAAFYNRSAIGPFIFNGEEGSNALACPFDPSQMTEPARHLFVVSMLNKRGMDEPSFMRSGGKGRVQMLHHKQLAFRSLNESLAKSKVGCCDETFEGIWMFACMNINTRFDPDYEPHFHALLAVIQQCGGFSQLLRHSKLSKGYLFTFLIWAIAANTTRPTSTLIPMLSQSQTIAWVRQLETGTMEPFPCPFPLIINLVEVSILRRESLDPSRRDTASWWASCLDLLQRIEDFSTESWVEYKGILPVEWDLLARIFKASVALFAIATLTKNRFQTEFRRSQRQELFALLPKAWEIPTLTYCLCWPAVVAGFEANTGSIEERGFVEDYLETMGKALGGAFPLLARRRLRKFWDSGTEDWDQCWDKPYMFTW